MSGTKVGIIASVAQRRRRWVVVPDSDAELPLAPRAGEVYIEQLRADYQQRGPDAAVQDHFAAAPLSDRCAVIDHTNTVAGHIKADPAIDALAGNTLVQSDLTLEGDTYAGGQFSRKWAQVNSSGVVTGFTQSPLGTTPVAANVGGSVVIGYGLTIGQTASA